MAGMSAPIAEAPPLNIPIRLQGLTDALTQLSK